MGRRRRRRRGFFSRIGRAIGRVVRGVGRAVSSVGRGIGRVIRKHGGKLAGAILATTPLGLAAGLAAGSLFDRNRNKSRTSSGKKSSGRKYK